MLQQDNSPKQNSGDRQIKIRKPVRWDGSATTGGVHCRRTHPPRRETGIFLWPSFNSYLFLWPIYPIIWTLGWQSIWFGFCTRGVGRQKSREFRSLEQEPFARSLPTECAKHAPHCKGVQSLHKAKLEIRGSNEAVDNCLLHAKPPKEKPLAQKGRNRFLTFFPSHLPPISLRDYSSYYRLTRHQNTAEKLTWGWRKRKINSMFTHYRHLCNDEKNQVL